MEENIAITPESNELISKNEWILIWRRLRAKKLASGIITRATNDNFQFW